MEKAEIVPSLLSADFSALGEEIRKVEKAGCKRLHLDVMDGHFVPNITFGPMVIKAIRKKTKLYLQTHLMIECPEEYLTEFKKVGSDCLIIHQEACCDFQKTVKKIKSLGMDVGVALRPKTLLETIKNFLQELDMILIMTVEPGFGGQPFIRGMEKKIARAGKLIEERNLRVHIGVDGGINLETAPLVVNAGATLLIAGEAVFKGDVLRNIRALNNSIQI
ncbi:MAG TPA: ribulose-phosphate 3-epimerase [Terriglobales bacterium]|nr:ribulose-phosphate 3-epimerase [Terriglobales bacterium]